MRGHGVCCIYATCLLEGPYTSGCITIDRYRDTLCSKAVKDSNLWTSGEDSAVVTLQYSHAEAFSETCKDGDHFARNKRWGNVQLSIGPPDVPSTFIEDLCFPSTEALRILDLV